MTGSTGIANGGEATARAVATETALAHYPTFQNVLNLIRSTRDQVMMYDVETYVRLASYAPGRSEFEPTGDAPSDLAAKLGKFLSDRTGTRWAISVVSSGGEPTIAEVRDREENEAKAKALAHPLVQSVLAAFPGTQVTEVRSPEALAMEAAQDALPEVDEEWDPFEED